MDFRSKHAIQTYNQYTKMKNILLKIKNYLKFVAKNKSGDLSFFCTHFRNCCENNES